MKLVIISGRSGSGKTAALNALEDIGFYCIDNLPAALLPALLETYKNRENDKKRLAVCIDARNSADDIKNLAGIRANLSQDTIIETIYLDSSDDILLKRFSETRRKHPLSDQDTSLKQALDKERKILEPISQHADLHIHTDLLSVHELRNIVKKRLKARVEDGSMSLLFSSFGFKRGLPTDADLVFDVRCLPNPYWNPELRAFSGKQQEIIDFLGSQPEVAEMYQDIEVYLSKWLPSYSDSSRSYLTVAIGCTGGRHRSVYIADKLYQHFQKQLDNVQVFHRDLV